MMMMILNQKYKNVICVKWRIKYMRLTNCYCCCWMIAIIHRNGIYFFFENWFSKRIYHIHTTKGKNAAKKDKWCLAINKWEKNVFFHPPYLALPIYLNQITAKQNEKLLTIFISILKTATTTYRNQTSKKKEEENILHL